MTAVKEPAKIGLVPNQPKTPARAVRIDDATWEAIKAEAARRALPGGASDVVREALAKHLDQRVCDDHEFGTGPRCARCGARRSQ